jgi:hypothetical protein
VLLGFTVEIKSDAVELLEDVVELVVLLVVEVEVRVLEVVEVEVVVVDVEVVPGSIAATSFEKYEGRAFHGLPPPRLVM